MKRRSTALCFAICINDGGYVDDLKVRTIYQVLPDESSAKSNYLRIVDETGEDYLYPAAYFVLIDVPQEVQQAFALPKLPSKFKGERNRARRRPGGKHKVVT